MTTSISANRLSSGNCWEKSGDGPPRPGWDPSPESHTHLPCLSPSRVSGPSVWVGSLGLSIECFPIPFPFPQPLGSNPQQALKPTTTSRFQLPTPKWENLMGTAWMGPSLVQSVGQGRAGGAPSRSATLWWQACCKRACGTAENEKWALGPRREAGVWGRVGSG